MSFCGVFTNIYGKRILFKLENNEPPPGLDSKPFWNQVTHLSLRKIISDNSKIYPAPTTPQQNHIHKDVIDKTKPKDKPKKEAGSKDKKNKQAKHPTAQGNPSLHGTNKTSLSHPPLHPKSVLKTRCLARHLQTEHTAQN